MNGIVSKAKVQPDIIANKPASATMNIADLLLVLKTDNTLASARFDTIVNSTSSALPLADSTKNGMLRQVSGLTTDFVDGTNNCKPLTNLISMFLPPGIMWDYAGATVPTGWLLCDGRSYLRTDYPALFTAIGTVFGSADSTHFNVPNCIGRKTVGAGAGWALASFGGSVSSSLAIANLPAHAHSIADQQHTHATVAHTHSDSGHQHGVINPYGATAQYQAGGTTDWVASGSTPSAVGYASLSSAAPNTDARFTGINATNNAGSGTAFNTLDPYLAVNKIIKI